MEDPTHAPVEQPAPTSASAVSNTTNNNTTTIAQPHGQGADNEDEAATTTENEEVAAVTQNTVDTYDPATIDTSLTKIFIGKKKKNLCDGERGMVGW